VAVGEGTASLAIEVEVAELVLNKLELLLVVDSDDSGIKGFSVLAADLGLLNIDAGQLLDKGRKFGGGEL
jgi:hypothetical protein